MNTHSRILVSAWICLFAIGSHAQQETGNGSLPIEFIFEVGQRASVSMLRNLASAPTTLEKVKPGLDKEIWDKRGAIANAIESAHWEGIRPPTPEKDTCFWREVGGPMDRMKILISPNKCKEQGFVFAGTLEGSEKSDLVKLLLGLTKKTAVIHELLRKESALATMGWWHEAAHHLLDADEKKANAVAGRLWQVWYPLEKVTTPYSANTGKLQVGSYVSQSKEWNRTVTLKAWPEGGFLVSGASRGIRAKTYEANKSPYAKTQIKPIYEKYRRESLAPILFTQKQGLPKNVFFYENTFLDTFHENCDYEYKAVIIATSDRSFYVKEYFPHDIKEYISKGYYRCKKSGEAWWPQFNEYHLEESSSSADGSTSTLFYMNKGSSDLTLSLEGKKMKAKGFQRRYEFNDLVPGQVVSKYKVQVGDWPEKNIEIRGGYRNVYFVSDLYPNK